MWLHQRRTDRRGFYLLSITHARIAIALSVFDGAHVDAGAIWVVETAMARALHRDPQNADVASRWWEKRLCFPAID